MAEAKDPINYDKLIEKALLHVVADTLKIVEKQGLPGEHHFYISFRTAFPGVIMSELVRRQYPEEMTIVLQNRFENLHVDTDSFSVTLYFSRIPCPITVPFAAITYFGDPAAKMGLSFGSEIDSNIPAEAPKTSAEIISIDAFRNKKNA